MIFEYNKIDHNSKSINLKNIILSLFACDLHIMYFGSVLVNDMQPLPLKSENLLFWKFLVSKKNSEFQYKIEHILKFWNDLFEN